MPSGAEPPHDSGALTWPCDARFRSGLELFAAGDYFEAHEAWEELWLELDGAERDFLGALIQVAAACLKRDRGVAHGARRLWTRALARLDAARIDTAVDREALCRSLRAALADTEDSLRVAIEIVTHPIDRQA